MAYAIGKGREVFGHPGGPRIHSSGPDSITWLESNIGTWSKMSRVNLVTGYVPGQ